MKDSKIKFNFRMIIHTAQMLSDTLDNTDKLEEINNKPYIIKPKVRQTSRGYLFPLNANKLYDTELDNLTDFLISIKIMQEDLHITKWTFNRVDFAFDTKLKYDDIYIHSLYIICLLSEAQGIRNAIDIEDINTKKKRALTLKNSAFEFQIYDKKLESSGKNPYTRFEFRFKNIRNTDIYELINRLWCCINDL